MWDMTVRQFLAGLLYLFATIVALTYVLDVPELSKAFGLFWGMLQFPAS